MHTITSADGTSIAYDRTGSGPPLVLAGGAFSYRRYPGQVKLALLAAQFTVYSYDRRGRGDSGDTAPYAIEREIEDLAAVIGAADGHAHVWGLSSGAVLVLEAAAAGLPIRRLAVHDPPLAVDPADHRPPADLRERLTGLIGAGKRGEAVRCYMTAGMGAPTWVPGMLHLMPGAWTKLTAVAHTLPYDAALIEPYQAGRPLPAGWWGAVSIPTLVMCGTEKESPAILRHGSAAVAATLPHARSSSATASATPRSSPPRSSPPPSPSSSPTRNPTTPALAQASLTPPAPPPHERKSTMPDRARPPRPDYHVPAKPDQPPGHRHGKDAP